MEHVDQATRNHSDVKPPWQAPRIVVAGHVSEIVRGGGGKFSTAPADPGESRKPPGPGAE
jgi:hypothetical protein